ncbi:MAG: IclR family transcriptional regulator [Micromonosporaceae bacterium]
MASEHTNQSVERAAAVLRAFTDGRGALRLSEVARRSGVGMSSSSRMLGTLESLGLVERDPVTGLYRLGLELLSLAGVAVNEHPAYRAGRQIAQRLAATTGLGANLAVRHADAVFYLCNFEGEQAPKSYSMLGHRNPLHATGLGKCLLLGLDSEQRRPLLGAPPAAYTVHSITDLDALDADLDTASRRGYAIESEELALGRGCLAAPLRDSTGAVVAALSVSGPLSALDLPRREAELAQRVIEAADQISVGLGYLSPAGSYAG